MKTKEFRQFIERNGFYLEDAKLTNCFYIYKDKNHCVGRVDYNKRVDFSINPTCPRNIAQVVLDYAYTPLNEREEEKKYRLRAILKNGNFENLYVSKNGDNTYLSTCRKSEFTQSEIDAVEFDTNFFIKEEVE